MSFTSRSYRRMAAVLVAVLAIAGFALAPGAQAVQETQLRRIAGDNRYDTAAQIALATFPDGATNAILATGEKFADALAANGLAGALGAPVLLTPTDTIHEDTAAALETLGATDVFLMGGPAAISQASEDALVEAGYTVTRIAGNNRYGTAAAAGDAIDASEAGLGTTGNGRTALVANGLKFPDAVSGSPLAYAGRLPVLLTEVDSLSTDTKDAIGRLQIDHVVILGGTAVISQAVQDEIDAITDVTVERVAGATRYFTNVAVMDFGGDTLDLSGPTAYLATGAKFPDALAGGVIAGANGSPLLLTQPDKLPGATQSFLEDNAAEYDEVVALGGPAAVSLPVLARAGQAAQLDSNQSFDVSPATGQAAPFSSGFGDPLSVSLDDTGAVEYSVSGLTPEVEYIVALLDPAVVHPNVEESRFVSYTLTPLETASIETIQGDFPGAPAGSGQERQQAAAAADADGMIVFVIDSAEQGSVYPVIFEDNLDGGAEGALDLSPAGEPLEPFGLGGRMDWVPTEAADGEYDNDPLTVGDDRPVVELVSRENNLFVSEDGDTFYYSSGDIFLFQDVTDTDGDENTTELLTVPGATASERLAAFEGILTVGDRLHIEYFSEGQSQFTIVEDELSDIESVTATDAGPGKILVEWTPVEQPDAVYDVYRDNNSDGELDLAVDQAVTLPDSPVDGSSLTIDEDQTFGRTLRYIVVPQGGTTGVERPTSEDDPLTPQDEEHFFFSNEVVVGYPFIGLTNGTTVSFNSGVSAAGAGDVWMLHFSQAVKLSGTPSITVGGQTYTDGSTDSSWTVTGSTVTVTLLSGANTKNFTYGASITDLSGVTDVGGNEMSATQCLADSDAPCMWDLTLEDNGPEWMKESTTCNNGDRVCAITFNEPVDEETATDPGSYGRDHCDGPNSLNSITLSEDGRTVTLTFQSALSPGDEIRPRTGTLTTVSAVEDSQGDNSGQNFAGFVRQDDGKVRPGDDCRDGNV